MDIVDENNKPLGITKERALVHKNGDWHNVAHVYTFNDKGEILVHLRSPFKDLAPNCWDTRFGGHVLAGNMIDETAIKELKEEVGIDAKIGDLIECMVYKYDNKRNREFFNIYCYKIKEKDKVVFNDKEVIEVKWMPVEKSVEAMKKNPDKWAASSVSIELIEKVYEDWKNLKNL